MGTIAKQFASSKEMLVFAKSNILCSAYTLRLTLSVNCLFLREVVTLASSILPILGLYMVFDSITVSILKGRKNITYSVMNSSSRLSFCFVYHLFSRACVQVF